MSEVDLEAAALEELKLRADNLGISYHPSIKADKLSAKVKEAMEPKEEVVKPVSDKDKVNAARKDALKLIRVNISCRNSDRVEYVGDTFGVGNSVVGTIQRYVQFDAPTHVPNILVQHIKAAKHQVFSIQKGEKGKETNKGRLVPTYNVIELDPLTPEELAVIKERQLANNSVG